MDRHLPTRIITVASMLIGSLMVAPAIAQAGPKPRAEASVPVIAWTACSGATDPTAQCATVPVPVDYDQPSGPTITLALKRLPATDPGARKGSLFLNPGGPGESGVGFLDSGAITFPAALRARYDIVGVDPRGIGASTPVRCFTNAADAAAAQTADGYPEGAAELAAWETRVRTYAESCRKNAGPILDHMSTANVARDLDLLRRAVGDQRLNYLGYSYGSYLGETYAAMYPKNVGAFVIDGVLDPVAWSTGTGASQRLPFTTRLGSDRASERALQEFFRQCDAAGDACATSAGGSRQRYEALLAAARRQPIPFPGVLGVFFDDRNLIGATSGALYRTGGWESFADYLALFEAEVGKGAGAPAAGPAAPVLPAPTGSTYSQFEGIDAVTCSETDNPKSFSAWPRAADQAARKYPHFGRQWTWQSSVCAFWPARDADRYTGPFRTRTATPVLVVGTRYDPSTSYDGAVAANRLLQNSRLLTYEGWGHKAYLFAKNQCVDDAVTAYLVDGTLPAHCAKCQPERSPFAAVNDGGTLSPDALLADLTEDEPAF